MLTPAQIEARRGKLTASRVACLMNGNAEQIMDLYREMIEEIESPDLSRVWAVLLGNATEQLQLNWYELNGGGTVTRRGEVVTSEQYPWAAATLDGWIDDLACPIEAKHCGGREPIEVIYDRYYPQCQWQAMVTASDQVCLSTIIGANAPIYEWPVANREYQEEMISRGRQFMFHVRMRKPPVHLALEPVPVPADVTKIYDFTGHNMWGDAAATWLANWKSKKLSEDAEKTLKSLVPPDSKKSHGYGVRITRDRAGRLSLREDD